MHSNPGFITWDLTDQSQPLGNDSQNSLRPFAWRKSFIATCKFQRIDPLLRQKGFMAKAAPWLKDLRSVVRRSNGPGWVLELSLIHI